MYISAFQVRLVRSYPESELFEETLSESYRLYKKYQMRVHNDKEEDVSMRKYKRFLCESPLEPSDVS